MAIPKPDFAFINSAEILNVKNGNLYHLVPADKVLISEKFTADVQANCSEPLIYDQLFRQILNGETYTSEKAKGFLDWAHKGWHDQTHFVFLVLDRNKSQICGAIDIKSNTLEAAEIGYWASSHHSGIVTPSVAKLIEIARFAGFKGLHAYVDPLNERSCASLLRNKFIKRPDLVTHKNNSRFLFQLDL